MTDWHSKFGSGPSPISPRKDIVRLQEIEEAALIRAERAIRMLHGRDDQKDCDVSVDED